MKRVLVILIAALVVVAVSTSVASAQGEREIEPEIELLDETVGGLAGADAAEWTTGLAGVETALADARSVAPDLDYSELDAAIVGLKTAIDGGDVAEMEAAGVLVADAVAGVVAQAGDGTEAPTGVATGSAVPTSGPSVGLLAVAGGLVLLAGGALTLRRPTLAHRPRHGTLT
jgi:hypothetical protein